MPAEHSQNGLVTLSQEKKPDFSYYYDGFMHSQGDPTKFNLDEIKKLKKIIGGIIKRYFFSHLINGKISVDEAFSLLYEKLCVKFGTESYFSPGKSEQPAKFSTWVGVVIFRIIYDQFRAEKYRPNIVNFSDLLSCKNTDLAIDDIVGHIYSGDLRKDMDFLETPDMLWLTGVSLAHVINEISVKGKIDIDKIYDFKWGGLRKVNKKFASIIDRLSLKYRFVFNLHTLGNFTYEEMRNIVAEKLNEPDFPMGSLKPILFRVRQKIKQAFEKEYKQHLLDRQN